VVAGVEAAVCSIRRARRCDGVAIGERRGSGALDVGDGANLSPRVGGNRLNERKMDGGQMAAGAVAQRS
jgi:hypothetical protein